MHTLLRFGSDAAFLLAFGGALLTVELLCLQFALGASLLAVSAFGLQSVWWGLSAFN